MKDTLIVDIEDRISVTDCAIKENHSPENKAVLKSQLSALRMIRELYNLNVGMIDEIV